MREFLSWPTTVALLLAVLVLIYLAWRGRRERKPFRILVKDGWGLEVPQWFVLLCCAVVILMSLHRDAHSWAIKYLELRPESIGTTKPRFVTQGEWHCARGITAYRNKDYDRALGLFAKVDSVDGPAYVRWKFYEAMAIFRQEQFKKSVLRDQLDPEAVTAIYTRLHAIVREYRDDILYDDAKYWYAQCLRYLMDRNDEAIQVLRELLQEKRGNAYYRWREGTMYYLALMLLDKDEHGSTQEGISILHDLVQNHGDGMIQPVEMGRESYRVRLIVRLLAEKRGILDAIQPSDDRFLDDVGELDDGNLLAQER